MSKIFISYRRDDDPNGAARLRDGLAAKFGQANLFMDVDDLLAGQRFDDELAKALATCDVLIAIIGIRWLDLLKVKSTSGERDYVCEEIAAALNRKIAVIPVRVGREGQLAPLPLPDELPIAIRDLIQYQKHDVVHERFARDCAALSEAITVARRKAGAEGQIQRHWVLTSAVAIAATGGLAALWLTNNRVTDVAQPAPQEKQSIAQQKGWLGIGTKFIPDNLARDTLRMNNNRGALVVHLESGSPAASAGILVNDAITKINAETIDSPRYLSSLLDDTKPEQLLIITVRRAHADMNFRVRLGKRPESASTVSQ